MAAYNTQVAGRDYALLERHPLLFGLDAEDIATLTQAGEIESFHAGDMIVEDGALGDSMYLLLSGTTRVVKGKRTLATLKAGDFFGEMCMLEPAPRSATVIADESVFVFRLPHAAIQRLAQGDPIAFNRVLVRVVRALSQRLRMTNQHLASVGKLADWLAGSLV